MRAPRGKIICRILYTHYIIRRSVIIPFFMRFLYYNMLLFRRGKVVGTVGFSPANIFDKRGGVHLDKVQNSQPPRIIINKVGRRLYIIIIYYNIYYVYIYIIICRYARADTRTNNPSTAAAADEPGVYARVGTTKLHSDPPSRVPTEITFLQCTNHILYKLHRAIYRVAFVAAI